MIWKIWVTSYFGSSLVSSNKLLISQGWLLRFEWFHPLKNLTSKPCPIGTPETFWGKLHFISLSGLCESWWADERPGWPFSLLNDEQIQVILDHRMGPAGGVLKKKWPLPETNSKSHLKIGQVPKGNGLVFQPVSFLVSGRVSIWNEVFAIFFLGFFVAGLVRMFTAAWSDGMPHEGGGGCSRRSRWEATSCWWKNSLQYFFVWRKDSHVFYCFFVVSYIRVGATFCYIFPMIRTLPAEESAVPPRIAMHDLGWQTLIFLK